MSAVVLGPDGQEVEEHTVTPRRVRLPRAALDRLAELVGVESPATQMAASRGTIEGLGARLGALGPRPATPAEPDPTPESVAATDAAADAAADAASGAEDVDELLTAAGLVADGAATEEGRAVMTVWHGPVLAVELEMLLVLRRGRPRVRSWHRNLDDWVVCLSTGDGRTFELAWLSADDWWLELGRASWVAPDLLRETPPGVGLPDVLETPWELLLATGEAVDRNRSELLDQMVADYTGLTRAGTGDDLEVVPDADVRRWHEQLETAARGRLHAAVMGRSERGRPGAGIVEWVLFADGWRSLTPFERDGWRMVRIERRGPVDLSRELSLRAAGVTS